MKPARLLLGSLLLSLLVLVNAEGAEVESVVFAEDPWPPYTLGDFGAPTGGIATSMVQEIFDRVGINVELQLLPWKRVLKLAEVGKIDGIMLLMKKPERERYLTFTEMVFEGRDLFYYNTKKMPSFDWTSLADFKDHTIGLVSGFTYDDDFLKAVETYKLNIVYIDTPENRMAMLHKGNIDFLLGDEAVTNQQLTEKEQWRTAIRPAARPLSVHPMYMAVAKKSPAASLLPEINSAIKSMQEDGTMDKLLGRHDPGN